MADSNSDKRRTRSRGSSDSLGTRGGKTPDEQLRGQIEKWRSKLLDLGNRNVLVNCSFSTTRGVVELLHPQTELIWRRLAANSSAGTHSMRFPWRRELVPPPAGFDEEPPAAGSDVENKPKEWYPPLEECLTSRKLTDRDLMTSLSDRALERRLRTLHGHAQLSLSEQGVHCLFLAFGFVKWYESTDSDIEHYSPLMLVPVSLSRVSADAPWELTEAEDDAIENLCLRERLKQDFGLNLPSLPDIDTLEEADARQQFLNEVRHAIRSNDRWAVVDRSALGRFAFPKIAMWQDLGDHSESVLASALCRNIGGDTSQASLAFGVTTELPLADNLDNEIQPGDVKTILDCDSSQLEAIIAARRGVSFVLDGPPGTGKSQTIANIIADALSEGRKVLFVSEKVSALEVVKRRLDDCGLGEFCLECHSSKANRKAVLDELKWCLDLPAEVYDDATSRLQESLHKRARLNNYVRMIHTRRTPLDMSPFELFGHVTRLSRQGFTFKSHCELPPIDHLDRVTFDDWLQMVDRAREFTQVIQGYSSHPWQGCQLTMHSRTLADDIRLHFSVLSDVFEQISRSVHPLVDSRLIPNEPALSDLESFARSLREALAVPSVPSSWFTEPRIVAETMLRLCDATEALADHQSALTEFISDVEDHLSPSQLTAVTQQSGAEDWIVRIRGNVPISLRKFHAFIDGLTDGLRRLVASLETAESLSTEITRRLPFPIRAEISIARLPALISLARLLASVLPIHSDWLIDDYWPVLREASHTALTHLDSAAAIAKRLQVRVANNQLMEFARTVPSSESLARAWDDLSHFAPDASLSRLSDLSERLGELKQDLIDLQVIAREVLEKLGIADPAPMTLTQIRAWVVAGPRLVSLAAIHGHWKESPIRIRLKAACEAAIGDLKYAGELRARLDGQLSHRAFKATGYQLAERAVTFHSIWKRWFGGFKAFRIEAADLFNQGLPPTQHFLANLADLRTWHRRVSDTITTAAELAPHLPRPIVGEELRSWQELATTLQNMDRLAELIPDVISQLPAQSITIDRVALDATLTRMKTKLDRLASLTSETSLGSLMDDVLSMNDQIERFRRAADSVNLCETVRASIEPYYVTPPKGVATFFEDVRLANQYRQHFDDVTSLFHKLEDRLPSDVNGLDPTLWRRVLDSVQAAEQVAKLTRCLPTYHDVLSQSDRVDTEMLHDATDRLEQVFTALSTDLGKVANQLILILPHSAAGELNKIGISELLSVARQATQALDLRSSELLPLVSALRSDHDVDLTTLPTLVCNIKNAQKQKSTRDACRRTLEELGVEWGLTLPEGGRMEAQWLKNALIKGGISPLVRAIASQLEVRQQVSQIAEEIKAVTGHEYRASLKFLRKVIPPDVETSQGTTLSAMCVHDLGIFIGQLRSQIAELDQWLKFQRWSRDMDSAGLGGIVRELLENAFAPDEAQSVVAARFYNYLFDRLFEDEPTLGEFELISHEQIRDRFRKLDEWEIKAASARIRQYQLTRQDRPRSGVYSEGYSELGILQREVQKKRRQLPLRKLFAEIPSVLQRLKPCIMMSPLSVSTFLQSDEIRFDLVIFDEASQVFPWDSIGAIYRGSQLIVAGDEQQLPPTNFFNRADLDSDEENNEDIGDFESILSLCKSIGMPSRGLRWHYRSRREPLIAFSNRHFYGGDLVTFPSVHDVTNDAVKVEFVPQGRWIGRANLAEAERVTDLIVRHLRSRSEMSLGVIALNQSQQMAIEDAIYERRRKHPEIEALFHASLSEPLFIKNLENVQGDERDCIILSMGYGYNEAGKFLKNFGPLTKSGGERRLNVAVTRARCEVTFVASVKSSDMDLSGSNSRGSHLLKGYLEYAERGVETLGCEIHEIARQADSEFEQEVATALIEHGLSPVSQVGCGGYRIDLALKHPARTSEFCLGIECDGANYHSSKTARDRDRIRQDVLENLGWQLIRIWSADWVRNPQRQIDRILAAYTEFHSAKGTQQDESVTDNDLMEIEPHFIEIDESPVTTFKSIKDVPEQYLRKTLVSVVERVGAVDPEGLIQHTARELGFARIGAKIRERIESALNTKLELGDLRWIGDRITTTNGG